VYEKLRESQVGFEEEQVFLGITGCEDFGEVVARRGGEEREGGPSKRRQKRGEQRDERHV
jgi:hypothetical protein